MSIERYGSDDRPPSPQTDEPADKASESTVKTDERPRNIDLTDANGLTAAELRFRRGRVDEVEKEPATKSGVENDQIIQAVEPRAERDRPAPADEADKHDAVHERPGEASTSVNDRHSAVDMTDSNGRTAAELRFERHQCIDEAEAAAAAESEQHQTQPSSPDLSVQAHPDFGIDGQHGQPSDSPAEAVHPVPTEHDDGNDQSGSDGSSVDPVLDHNGKSAAATTKPVESTDHLEPPPEQADKVRVTEVRVSSEYKPDVPPIVHERYLVRDRANPIPLFDGPPARNQANQGIFGDCGVIAAMGAVAGHRPDIISNTIKETGSGEYEVTLHEVTPATPRDLVARPTGRTVTYQLNDELPISATSSERGLIGASARTCGWGAILEKAVAAQDQGWSTAHQEAWTERWNTRKKAEVDALRGEQNLGPSPTDPPTGYDRISTGTNHLHRATLLAEITGQEAEAKLMPSEEQGEEALLDEFRTALEENKPILVGSRSERVPREHTPFPRETFAFSHVYEVVKVENSKLHLRNPWGADEVGRSSDPPPMDVQTFWEYFRQYGRNGSRTDGYSTLR